MSQAEQYVGSFPLKIPKLGEAVDTFVSTVYRLRHARNLG